MQTDIPLLEVRNLKKYFPITAGPFRRLAGWVQAVDDVSFTVPRGQTLGLVGESGSGKTTVAKVLLRLEEPTSGDVLLNGSDLFSRDPRLQKSHRETMQAVFQDPGSSLNPRMAVETIIAEPMLVGGKWSKRDARARVREVLAEVGIRPQDGNKYPHEFSGGQRQRVAIARALALRPKLIVLDEPVSSLDVSVRAQVMNLLKDLQEEYGLSYLLIAHDIGTMRYLSDWTAVMYLGQIVEQGPPGQLCSQPFHPYTQELVTAARSTAPMSGAKVTTMAEIPSPINPPAGCRFHTRCPTRMAKCSQVTPEVRRLGVEREASCHLYEPGRFEVALEVRNAMAEHYWEDSESNSKTSSLRDEKCQVADE
ncbi:MAG: oligopeptide/dipeptide ABC transporter ATP-binding protein [Trueperaceae bacterium]